MRTAILPIIAFIMLAALSWPAPSQPVITVIGASQLRDFVPASSAGLATAASDVIARIQFDSPNAMRTVPLLSLPAGLVTALADVPYRLYLPSVVR
jgi:hypothetical protein